MTKYTREHLEAAFRAVQNKIHITAIDKGWWREKRNEGELHALIHSEISESLEGLRAGNPPDDKIPEYTCVEAELADAVIRILDYAEGFNYDVIGAMFTKMKFNTTREDRHGGKKF